MPEKIWGRRFGHDVTKVDILTYARKVNIQPGQVKTRQVHTAGSTRERRRIERERALQCRLVHAEHATQINALLGLALQLVEGFARKDIRLGGGQAAPAQSANRRRAS